MHYFNIIDSNIILQFKLLLLIFIQQVQSWVRHLSIEIGDHDHDNERHHRSRRSYHQSIALNCNSLTHFSAPGTILLRPQLCLE